MRIDTLDLLAKGWKPSEIDQASKIIADAEGDKHSRIKFIDGLLLFVLGALMLLNCFICSVVLVPFIYTITTQFIFVIVALVGFAFSILFTILIYDVEKIHRRHETNLFIAFIVTGIVNFYFLIQFSEIFGTESKLPLVHNIYIIASLYLITFLMPNIVYQARKNREL